MDEVAISVVVSARDAEATIGATIAGVLAQLDAPPYEVIVVDNGSNDTTPDIIQRHTPAVRMIRRTRGDGPGIARNEGAAAARGSIIAFTDADCAPTQHWLRTGFDAMENADIVQGAVRPTEGAPVGVYDRTLAVASEYGMYETANLFVRREWFEKVGGFVDWAGEATTNETTGRTLPVPKRPFGEDAYFAWSARRLGARTTFAPDALVHHAVFDGDMRSYIAEQARIRYFPALVARIPELRTTFAWRRYFLNSRTAAFDAAGVGVVAAAALTSPIPLVAAVPYAVSLYRSVRKWRMGKKNTVTYAAAQVARDAVGFASLVRGSVEARTPLL